jgi:hypothetical protein
MGVKRLPGAMEVCEKEAAEEEFDDLGDDQEAQKRAESLLKERWVSEDQCRWTIFEDMEDELWYHRRRSRALRCFVRAYASLQKERDKLQTAGLGLQEAYEQLEDELNDAVGEAAYWRALAEGDVDSPKNACRRTLEMDTEVVDPSPEGDAPSDSASDAPSLDAHSSEEEQASGEEEANEAYDKSTTSSTAAVDDIHYSSGRRRN